MKFHLWMHITLREKKTIHYKIHLGNAYFPALYSSFPYIHECF